MHLSMLSRQGAGEAGHGVGIWHFSKICLQIPCPRANHSSQMQPNSPTQGCTCQKSQGWTQERHNKNRVLKKRRRRRLRKRYLKMNSRCLKLYRAYSVSFNSSTVAWQISLELNSKGLYQSSGKEKENCCFVFPSSIKREIRHFHVVVVQRLQEMYKRAWCTCKVVVLPIQTYWFFAVPVAVAVVVA